jgi:hypothetical protein
VTHPLCPIVALSLAPHGSVAPRRGCTCRNHRCRWTKAILLRAAFRSSLAKSVLSGQGRTRCEWRWLPRCTMERQMGAHIQNPVMESVTFPSLESSAPRHPTSPVTSPAVTQSRAHRLRHCRRVSYRTVVNILYAALQVHKIINVVLY